MRVVVGVVMVVAAVGCGRSKTRPTATPRDDGEARVRAAFPPRSPVGMPSDLHGLAQLDDGSIVLPELPKGRNLALLTEAWGAPVMDLASPMGGGKGQGWSSGTGTCALLTEPADAPPRLIFMDCDVAAAANDR